MAALTNAALRGISVRDGTMYVTTFPCHLCAPHIVAAGIKRVVYIEPYPKSMVSKLYPDSISVDGSHDHDRVKFEPFFGFAPKIYMRYFDIPNAPEREDQKGEVIPWNNETMQFRTKRYVSSYLFIEMRAIRYLGAKLSAQKEKIDTIRREKEWGMNLELKSLHLGNVRIEDWLKGRKKVIDNDLQNVPYWMKQAIFPHGYM
jgi:cytidine deaminase